MLQTFRGVLGVVGRVLLCAVFFAAALGCTTPNPEGVAQVVAGHGLLSSRWAAIGGICLLLVGGVSVMVGYKARIGATFLLLFLGATTYFFHGISFWTLINAQARQEQVIFLLTNLSLMGAMLFLIANGPGRMSLDARRR